MSMPLSKTLTQKLFQVNYRVLLLAFTISLIFFIPACKKGDSPTGSTGSTGNGSSANSNTVAPGSGPNTTPEAALENLIKGNERFANGITTPKEYNKEKIAAVANGQRPTAIVLTCSESMVSPELLFDQSIGDLFVIRLAGNVVDKAGVASIEYAAEQFKTPLLFVLGEEKCGAVSSVVNGTGPAGTIPFLVNEIKPAIAKAKGLGGDLIAKSVDENVRHVVDTMPAKSAIITKLIQENKLKIAGGTYSLANGKVNIVSE